MATRTIFNARTQQDEAAELAVDDNNEIVATFKDGSIVKFPSGLDETGFAALIAAHKIASDGQEIITPEMEAQALADRQASLSLIGETEVAKPTPGDVVAPDKLASGGTPEEATTDAPDPTDTV